MERMGGPQSLKGERFNEIVSHPKEARGRGEVIAIRAQKPFRLLGLIFPPITFPRYPWPPRSGLLLGSPTLGAPRPLKGAVPGANEKQTRKTKTTKSTQRPVIAISELGKFMRLPLTVHRHVLHPKPKRCLSFLSPHATATCVTITCGCDNYAVSSCCALLIN
jgi:hypothetical protein